MFAALVQQRTEHSHAVDRLMFFETCVQELKERKDTDVVTVAAAATGGAGGRSGGFGSEIVVNGRQCLDDLSVSPKGAPLWTSDSACGSPLLIHQAVASMARREKLQMQQQQRIEHAQLQHHEALMIPASSPTGTTAINSPSRRHHQSSTGFFADTLPSFITVPGPSAEECMRLSKADACPGTSGAVSNQLSVVTLPSQPQCFSYTKFPIFLDKEWMAMPSSSLPPILHEVMTRRDIFLKKGNRMILARSVSECMKDWQVVSKPIGGTGDKEIYLALQIFGISLHVFALEGLVQGPTA